MTFPLMPMVVPSSRLGENWDSIGDPSYGALRGVATRAAGVVMIGAPNFNVLYSDDYGDSLTLKDVSSGTDSTFGIAYGHGRFLVDYNGGDRVAYSTTNGDSWGTAYDASVDNRNITFNDGVFVIGSGAEGGSGFAYFSYDGLSWYTTPEVGPNSLYCGIYVNSINRTFVGGVASQCKYRIGPPPSSASGDSWTGASTGFGGTINAVAWSDDLGIAVCVGTNGIYSSYSMSSWAHQVGPAGMSNVAWCADQFVAVGGSGRIFTSPDGLTWTQQVSGTTSGLYGIVYTNGVLIATGDDGTILRSS